MQVSLKQLKKETNQSPGGVEIMDMLAPDEAAIAPEEKPSIKAVTTGNILSDDVNREKRKEMIEAKGFEPAEFAFERAIGNNDSLYSNFTELIALTKRKVGRIVVIEDNKREGFATGFMVSKNLLLTNWHVFKTIDMAVESEVHFFYEYDAQGHPLAPVIFKFDPATFYTADKDLDYCFVAVQPTDVSGKVSLDSIGYLYLDKALGKIGDEGKEKLNIIHHPQGDYKQISIRENTFTGIEPTKIFYETDTAQGSSGSPVFNDQWQVVGLHHKSIAKMNANGDYLDKDDNVIPIINDKIDVTRVVWLKNEGMRISVILKHLNQQHPGNAHTGGIAVPPPVEKLVFMVNNNTPGVENADNSSMPAAQGKNIMISVPSNALNSGNSIDISLSSKKLSGGVITTDKLIADRSTTDELLLEVAKADKESAVDFSKCRGYDINFLGVDIPLPKPSKTLEKQIARLKNNTTELKYFKYSVLFNAVTKMPALSAINVEGDADKRLDDSKRSDDWLRDKRIDIESQLTDKFYAKSNFDKGHMSRFEDANWDTTEEKALRNGIYTCFYTNACPQVVKLNRAAGFWGKLEKAVLEKGIKKEAGKLARMTVFNGPIFNEEKDRIFKGVTIPMDFYKIICWLNDDNELRATAFKLSQELLVGHIKFDESMRLDEEALDIDKDVVFKEFQCSIKSLSRATKLDFNFLSKFDTFKPGDGSEEMLMLDEEAMML